MIHPSLLMPIFKGLMILSFILFILPDKLKWALATFYLVLAAAISQYWSYQAFATGELVILFLEAGALNVKVSLDPLSGLMISLINLVSLSAWFYGIGYLKKYRSYKKKEEFTWHYFNYLWLYFAMFFVVSFREGFSFLFAWEIMSLTSFFLVSFEHEKKETHEAAVSYLIQMHIGMLFLLLGFSLAENGGNSFGFDGVGQYMNLHSPILLFILFFIGFGMKAGFIPFHTWLPQAHPAAPSHVSGLMSGIMIKMGIYGIFRITQYLPTDYLALGIFVLFVSLLSSIGGISLASVQTDLKKVLAYSSIENIGIIGLGIGLGLVGKGTGIQVLSFMGFTGALFHMINHALFKPLLFMGAGNVYQQLHYRNLEKMGGLGKLMPYTAGLFLLGSIAISGIPPFNGFISEFFLYLGIFKTLNLGELSANVIGLFVLAGLVITGGLATFSFTRIYSTVFQGHPRSAEVGHAKEVNLGMLAVMSILAILLLVIGITPAFWARIPVSIVNTSFSPNVNLFGALTHSLQYIGLVNLVLVLLIGLLWWARKSHMARYGIQTSATWGCGYMTSNPEKFQYTATSQSYYMHSVAPLITGSTDKYQMMKEKEYFPVFRSFKQKTYDIIWIYFFYTPSRFFASLLQKMAIFHTGRIQTYLLYALIFIVLIGILSLTHIL